MDTLIATLLDPGAWVALAALVAMEIALGIDNIILVAVLADSVQAESRAKARRIGLGLALVLRLALLGTLFGASRLTAPMTLLGYSFTARDIVFLAGGLFLIYKGTHEIHARVSAAHAEAPRPKRAVTLASVISQIILLDLVFSIDSIVTAIGMTDHFGIMVVAVIIAVALMIVAADALAGFIRHNPTLAMLALAFLLMIGAALVADATGFHIPRGYIYAAMAFSAFVEALNALTRPKAT